MSKQVKDLTGQKFGKLTVIKRAPDYISPNGRKKIVWLCKCDCGNDNVIVRGEDLTGNHTKTCGCSWGQLHGKSNTKLYNVWKKMKERCNNPNSKSYKIYGAEGKKVCDEWLHDFQAFYEWSMANGYKEGLTIERIDGTKGYSPDNCKWTTRIEQMNNIRNNKYLTYNDKTKTRAQWAREMGINYNTLIFRLDKLNWDIEKALTTPIKKQGA